MTRYIVSVRISDGARKHGIAEDDMSHALQNLVAVSDEDGDGFTMFTGPARNGTPLEIDVLDAESEDPVIIHAMVARPEHLP